MMHLATEKIMKVVRVFRDVWNQYMFNTDEIAGCSNPDLCLTTWEETYYFALDSAAVAFSADEEADEALLAYWSSPIPIDLILGWNIKDIPIESPRCSSNLTRDY